MTRASFIEWLRGSAWTALIILVALVCFIAGCATVEPKACVAPPGSALISLDDVEKVNAEYARVRRELAACIKLRSS